MKTDKKIAYGHFENASAVTAYVPLCPALWDLVEQDAARFGASIADFISSIVREKYNLPEQHLAHYEAKIIKDPSKKR